MYGVTCNRTTPCTQQEKPERCSRVCLRGSIFGRTHIRNVTDMLRKYEGD